MIKALHHSIKDFITDQIWNYDKIKSRSVWVNYAIPFVLVILVSVLKFYLFANPFYRVPYLMFFAIILISACFGGSRAAFFATIMACLGTVFLLSITPANGWPVEKTHIFQSVTFLIEALVICILTYGIQATQEKLKNSEEKFRGIIENNDECFLMMDQNFVINYSSPSVQHMLGYEKEALHGEKLQHLLHANDTKGLKDAYKKLTETSESAILQYRLKRADNHWIWVESNISNLLKDDKIGVIVVHFRNITDRIIKEKQQEDFVHMATHELKSPVTVLKGYLQLLISKLEKEGNQQHVVLLHRMESQINKLITLISDMLDSTKVITGELTHKFEDFNLNDCIRECVDAIKTTAPFYQVTCELESSDLILKGDEERIGQVITNFLSNAVKYSPDKKNIKITSTLENGWAKVSVSDEGIGIPKEKQQFIFDRFYRVDSLQKAQFQGLGLGLYIASEIVKMHHGKIGVESIEDEGSTFWFCLPLSANS